MSTVFRRRSVAALYAMFFFNGIVIASWAPRIPAVTVQLHLDHARIGLCLLCVALGAGPALICTEKLMKRIRLRHLAQVSLVGLCALPGLIGFANEQWQLMLILFAVGVMYGVNDVCMNNLASAYEYNIKKSVMSSFHASFSIGTFTGALIGAECAREQVPYWYQFAIQATIFTLIAIACCVVLLDPPEPRAAHDSPERSFNVRVMLLLGCIAFGVLLMEGTTTDWSSMFLQESRHVNARNTGFGLTAFTAAMTIGRLCGDRLREAIGSTKALPLTAVITIIGTILVTTLHYPLVFGGFAVYGLGISCMFPFLVSIATSMYPGAHDRAITLIATSGYFAFLIGPALVGWLGQHYSLNSIAHVLPLIAIIVLGLTIVLARRAQETEVS